ncbi:MAG: hypothetical protein R3Y18_00030 [Bacillota bacterium]
MLFSVANTAADEIIKMIKVRQAGKLRPTKGATVHVQDYFEVFGITNTSRYTKQYEKEQELVAHSRSFIAENAENVAEFIVNSLPRSKKEVLRIDQQIQYGNMKLVGFSLIGNSMQLTVV